MSNETQMSGEIEIHPPIPWKYIRDSVFLPTNARGDSAEITDRKLRASMMRDIMFRVEQRSQETDDGTLVLKSAVALVPTHAGSNYAGSILKHLQEVVDAFPEHTFTGRIDGEGEESLDVWRIKVLGRTAMKFTPEFIWPEESK